MGRDLTFIGSLVGFSGIRYFQPPIVWILEFNWISIVSAVGMDSNCEQFKSTVFIRVLLHPRYLCRKRGKKKMEEIWIKSWYSFVSCSFHIFIHRFQFIVQWERRDGWIIEKIIYINAIVNESTMGPEWWMEWIVKDIDRNRIPFQYLETLI